MRKLPLLLAALGASALVLAGCSASTPEPFAAGCDTLAVSDPNVTDLVTVKGEFGVAPKVTMYSPFVTEQTVHSVVEAGHGRVIDTPNQLVSLDMALYSGTTGAQLVTSVFGDANPAKPIALSSWGETFEGLQRGLMCATEGSRVIVAMPSDDVAGGQGVGALGIAPGESIVAVVDVRDVFRSKADGADQFVAGHGLPTVVRAADGQPGVTIPVGAPPSEFVARTLKLGDGDTVQAGDTVIVQYTGLTWNERAVFDSSWSGPAREMSLDGVIPGFAQALEGQTVGSQVLAVIPPELGYGDQGTPKIPANSTLVFVVDILGIG